MNEILVVNCCCSHSFFLFTVSTLSSIQVLLHLLQRKKEVCVAQQGTTDPASLNDVCGNNTVVWRKQCKKRKEQDKRCHQLIDSEKNQIRPCDLVWFPSALASVSEHVVLPIRPSELASVSYATGTKFFSTCCSPALHFTTCIWRQPPSSHVRLRGDKSQTSAHICSFCNLYFTRCIYKKTRNNKSASM